MPDALVPSPDAAALEHLSVNEIDAALGVVVQSFGRRTLIDSWHIGRALRRVKDSLPGRQFAPYCERRKIGRRWAYQLLTLADGCKTAEEVCSYFSVDGAVKALKAAPVEPVEPAPAAVVEAAPVEPEPEPDPDPEGVIDAVAAEASPNVAAEQREALLERWAIRTEHEDGDEIERLNRIIDRMEVRHRDDVGAVNEARRRERAKDRKDAAVCDALLAAPGCPTCAGVLAKYYSVQWKKGAA